MKKIQQKRGWKEANARKGGEGHGEVVKKEECDVRRRQGKGKNIL